jgi:hypothetical protein
MWVPHNKIPAEAIDTTDFASKDELKKMSYEQQYDLITSESVWKLLHSMLDNLFHKNGNEK